MTPAERVLAWFEDLAGTHQATDAAVGAVRRVLDLHSPEEWNGHQLCFCCLDSHGGQQDYPCPTVRMISESIRKQDPSFILVSAS